MEVIDQKAEFNGMEPKSVSFYFADGRRSARVTQTALEALEHGTVLNSEGDFLGAYGRHWERLHAKAAEVPPDADGVVCIKMEHL